MLFSPTTCICILVLFTTRLYSTQWWHDRKVTSITSIIFLMRVNAIPLLKSYSTKNILLFCQSPAIWETNWTEPSRTVSVRKHCFRRLFARVSLLRRLVGSGWGESAETLHQATLSLVYSTAEYYASVWCRSAHIRLIESVLNDP